MGMYRICQAGLLGLVVAGAAVPSMADRWEGPKLKPVARQELFEFAKAPTFRKVGPDRYEIAFASRGACDVAVAIEDPADKVVKHLVYGVLGPNAPDPLTTDSLEQALVWNGKDDFGNYVKEPEKLRVRVSLGLKPTFDRIIGYHPKDMTGQINALGADADGVYVSMVGGYFSEIRAYHHDGGYKKTIFPFPADKLDKLKGLRLQPIMLTPTQADPDQPIGVPRRGGFGEIDPYEAIGAARTTLIAHGGVLHCLGGGNLTAKRIVRIGTDGSTGGVDAQGPILNGKYGGIEVLGEMAVSPDGKWVYLTRLIPSQAQSHPAYSRWPSGGYYHNPQHTRHAVYRISYDSDQPLNVADGFLGEGNKTDRGNDHFDNPEGIAVDALGRIYVADAGNNRVQAFTPDGKYVATVPVNRPRRIAVHHQTGEIYVSSYDFMPDNKKGQPKIIKLSALPNSKIVAEMDIPLFDPRAPSDPYWSWDVVVWCLDSWSAPPRLWIAQGNQLRIWEDRGNRFEFVEAFDDSVRKDGYQPHMLANYKMQRLSADHRRGHLYYMPGLVSHVLRMDDPAEGKSWKFIELPAGGGDGMQVGFDGLFYCRAVKWLARFDPESLQPAERYGRKYFTFDKEVPFDYGEQAPIAYGQPIRGAIVLPAMALGCGFNMGMGIAPNGNILTLLHNFHDIGGLARGQDKYFSGTAGGVALKLDEDRYRPAQFPGRLWKTSCVVFVHDRQGQVIGEDAVAGLHAKTTSIKGDRDGNIYMGLPLHAIIDGKEFGPFGGSGIGPGVAVKFAPSGGRLVGTWGDTVKLDPLPERAPDLSVHSGFGQADVWAQNLLWSVEGMSTLRVPWVTCLCPMSRLDVDWYGRVFIPETWRFSVNIVDTNGNRIGHVGRYGNAESGAGPDSPVRVPGGIAFSQCDFLAAETDKWLYVNDAGNHRIVRLKLGYHSEQRAPLQP